MKIKSTIKEINKLFDERYHGVMRAWRDKGFVLDLGKDIKSFYTQQILSLIEEMIGEDEKLPSFQNSTQFSEDGGEAIQGRNELRKEMRASIKSYKKEL